MSAAAYKATLEDVARSAGVHRSTVSLSLRDHPRIPQATRDRVKAAAHRLGYRIDPLVSALMLSRRCAHPGSPLALAYLAAGSDDRTASRCFPGAAKRAQELGFRLERVPWSASDSARTISDQLSLRRITGVVLEQSPAGATGGELDWNRFSCVAIGSSVELPVLHHVTENLFDAMCETMQRCRVRGYQRVGFVRTCLADSDEVECALAAFGMHQLRWPPEARLPVCPGAPAGLAAFSEWFLQHAPDALIVDDPALALSWLRRLGRAVPQDLGLVAVQPQRAARCAGFYCRPATLGTVAVEILLGLLYRKETGVPTLAHKILLTGEWHEHATLPPRDQP